jgi:hypothetical protein
LDNEVKENEMGRAYGAHGEKRNAYRILMEKNQTERDHWEDKYIGGRIILKRISRK